MNYEPVIGLEVHVELKTKSKMFCRCEANYFGEKPNTHTCPTCLGLPGALPTINKQAIRWCVLIGMSLNCEIPKNSKFDRKNYFYPDLPKGYQISQYDSPFCKNGILRNIGIERVHQEEDTGKLIHEGDSTLIDFNRSGVPLVEIVTKPEIRSADQAKKFLQELQKIIRYLDVSDCDMEKGSMRLEPNISVRKKGQTSLPAYKVEVKNINSFKFVEKAIDFEINRQIDLLEKGEKIPQETRGYDSVKNITYSQRSKETAQDYRYFPEPDLPPIVWDEKEIKKIKQSLPELPEIKLKRFISDYQLTPYDAALLTEDTNTADWFEEGVRVYGQAKPIANWMSGELKRYLNETGKTVLDLPITPAHLSELLYLLDKGEVSNSNAKLVFNEMITSGNSPSSIISQKGLTQITDDSEIEKAVQKVLSENPKACQDYKSGKKQALGFLIGRIMAETHGKAPANKINEILRKLI